MNYTRQKLYILIALVLMWFVFGTIIMIRANKDYEDLKIYEGQILEIGTTITKIPVVGNPKDILYFTIKGMDNKLGIYHNTKSDYDIYLNKILPGDTVKVYFDEFGGRTMENINLHVFQLEKNKEILLSKEELNKTDRKVGLILYGVGLLFSLGPIWYYRKMKKKNYHQN